MKQHINNYVQKLSHSLENMSYEEIQFLAGCLKSAWVSGKTIYICGNGGSAGNAIHLANDLLFGAGLSNGLGLRVEALSANSAVLTCLANDIGYENIYSAQLKVKANPDDLLIVLSGSGNSPNVIKALEVANELKMKTFAIVAFDGGKCRDIAQKVIYFDINDMQIAEDLQLIVLHMCMQWLSLQTIEV